MRIRNPLRLVAALYRATVVAGVNRSRIRRGVGPLDRTGRRQLAGCTTVCAVVASLFAIGATGSPAATSASMASATISTAAAPANAAAMPERPAAVDDRFDVNRVIDGDTFVITDGRSVRVIGIDSCENHGADASPGGDDAKAQAESLIAASGWKVDLTTQPGAPDVDRDGRLLRYVRLTSGDFGVQMVGYDHTGIYQGDNDASQTYLDQLYAHDLDYAANPPSGRECGAFPPPAPAPAPTSGGADDGDVDHYVPVPIPHHDDDHHKSRFCRRHWFC
jgi:endonuclease YncB( thermonuclease family)